MKIILPIIIITLLVTNISVAQTQVPVELETCKIEKVYPNPFTTHVYVEISLEDYSTARFQLVDILGNKVQEWEARHLFPGIQKVKLQIKTVHTGIYLLKIRVNGKVFVKRIRKN